MNYPGRVAQLQERLISESVDALLITHLPNVFYLTGFTGSAGNLLVFPQRVLFLTDGRYVEQASKEVSVAEIVAMKKGGLEETAKILLRRRVKRGAFEARHVSFETAQDLKRRTRNKIRWQSGSGWTEELRAVKSPEEVGAIESSLGLVEGAFEKTLLRVRPGVRERDLAAELEFHMKKHGAQKVSFDLIVASGPRSALPHGLASERRVGRNEFLVFDLGAILRGYSSDFTRTVFVGRPTAKAREIYSVVKESQECALAAVDAGVPASQIDHLARRTIRKKGYGRYFVHSTGHGIGIEVHEAPAIGARSRAVLQAGNVIAVEPGIYVPGFGGVRIEDLALVGRHDSRILTQTTKQLVTL
ncbi:MAG: aminopeptidase P family protein [Acidobacteriia bacterium]|nr:aminopeptidase P family protein [Terriglobia bacterium]